MGENIKLTTADGHSFAAYLSGDQNSDKALVVLPEIFGINPHMRRVTDRFAKEGFLSLAPSLFDRVESGVSLAYDEAGIAKGRELRSKIKDEEALQDIAAAARFLERQGRKIGVIGYCWGGLLAWLSSAAIKEFSAACCWYGVLNPEEHLKITPHCPTEMHFGEKDAYISEAVIERIKKAYPTTEIFVYPDAAHGFGCEDRSAYHAEACLLAETRSLAFLRKYL